MPTAAGIEEILFLLEFYQQQQEQQKAMVHSRLEFSGNGGLSVNLIDTRDTINREQYLVVRAVLGGDEVSKIVELMNQQRREEVDDDGLSNGHGGHQNNKLDDGITTANTAETCPAVSAVSSRYQILSNMGMFFSCLVEYCKKNSLRSKQTTHFDKNILFDESAAVHKISNHVRFRNIFENTKLYTHLSFRNDGWLLEQQMRFLATEIRGGAKSHCVNVEPQHRRGVKIRRLSFDNCKFSDWWDRNQTDGDTPKACLRIRILAEEGLKENREILSLSMVRCNLRDEDLVVILQNLPRTVETIDLSENYCRSAGMAALTSILINNAESDDVPSLKRLNLMNQHPGELGSGNLDLSLFGLSLPSNNTLVDLDLSFNMLTLHDIQNLVGGLQHNSALKNLNLMNNRLDDCAIRYIGKHLPRVQLRSLNLSANKFSETGADSLLKGLEKNYTLWDLFIPRGFAASDRIDWVLAANRGGRVLISLCLPLKEPKKDEKKKNTTFNESSRIGDRDVRYNSVNEEVENDVGQPALPLGIWPLALKRAGHLKEFSPTTRLSVAFHLLSHGVAPNSFSLPNTRQLHKRHR